MSYSAIQEESNVFIDVTEQRAAFEAVQQKFNSPTWNRLLSYPSLVEQFEYFGYVPYVDEVGNIIDLQFNNENVSAYVESFFQVVAPFIRSGSFIVMIGEDGSIWRDRFTDGQLYQDTGRIVFDES